MAAPKGNQYYLLNKSVGRKPMIDNVEFFIDGWNRYVEFCLSTPLMQKVVQKRKISRDEEVVEIVDLPHTRAFTIEGYCNFIEVSKDLFYDYLKKEAFSDILSHIQQRCYVQKFEGAASGFYNANIIARDLGLVDRADIESHGNITINWQEEKTYVKKDEA